MNALVKHVGEITMAGALRAIGALVLVAALCANLMEGWAAWSGVSRYYAMFGVTGLLAAAGLLISQFLGEQKSARVFLGLALLSVLANVTTIGGLINEYVQWDGFVSAHAQMQAWSVGAGVSILGVLASALFVLLPVTWLAYRVLARANARDLTLLFVLLASLILLPVRASGLFGLVLLVALAVPAYRTRQLYRREVALHTLEGRFALATLFAPAVVMVGRLLWLYEPDALLGLMLCALGYGVMHYVNLLLRAANPLRIVTIIAAGSVSVTAGWLVCELLPGGLSFESLLAVFGLVTGAGLAGIGLSQLHGRRVFFGGGVCIGLLGLTPGVMNLVGRVDLGNWLTLAVIGFSVLTAAALVERLRASRNPA